MWSLRQFCLVFFVHVAPPPSTSPGDQVLTGTPRVADALTAGDVLLAVYGLAVARLVPRPLLKLLGDAVVSRPLLAELTPEEGRPPVPHALCPCAFTNTFFCDSSCPGRLKMFPF